MLHSEILSKICSPYHADEQCSPLHYIYTRPAKSQCHSEPVRTLAWESLGSQAGPPFIIYKKEPTAEAVGFVLALPTFLGRPSIATGAQRRKCPWTHAVRNSPVDCCSQNCLEIRKESSFRLTLLYVGVTYLPG